MKKACYRGEAGNLFFPRSFCVKFFAFANHPGALVVGFELFNVALDVWLRKDLRAVALARLATTCASPAS
jgi:hypothetical protein